MDVEIGSKIRKTEDAIALGNAGVMMIRNLDFPEALERGMDLSAVFRDALPQQSSEKMLIDDVRREIQSLLANESIVLSPSGFGGHIDHLITRIAAESLQKTIYYADLPYAARTSKTATARSFLSGKRREATPASIPDIEEHLKLARIYASQIQDRHLGEMRAQLKEKGYPFWS